MRRLFLLDAPISPAQRYLFATGCCVATFAVRLLLDPLLQDHSPLLLFPLAVAISAIRGFGPGMLATCLGAVGSLYFFPPVGAFSIAHYAVAAGYRTTAAVQIILFFTIGVVLSWLGGELHQLRWQAIQLATQRNEILESITDGFEALDKDWRFVYLNRAAGQLVQAPRTDEVGRKIWDEIPEWRGTLVESKFREVLERRVAAHFEYFSKPSNRWLEFHVHPAESGGLTVYFTDISDRKLAELRLRETLTERDAALRDVQLLSGLLPICAGCKKIRDEQGAWHQMEEYISGHSQVRFSHGMCAECARQYYGDLERLTRGE